MCKAFYVSSVEKALDQKIVGDKYFYCNVSNAEALFPARLYHLALLPRGGGGGGGGGFIRIQ